MSTEHRTEPPGEPAGSDADHATQVTPGEAAGGDSPLPPRRIALLVLAAVLVIGLDVATKTAAVANLEGRMPRPVAGGLVYLQVLRNPGAAFGVATGMTWVLSLVAVAVAVMIIWFAPRLRSIGWAIGLGLVFGGAVGNLIDRLFRAPGPLQGRVVDFISVFAPDGRVFPVFNAADSAICTGGALIVLLAVLGRDYDGGLARREAADGRAAGDDA